MSEQLDSQIKLFTNHNEYVRSVFQIMVTWFTFFLGVNYLAIGWYASEAFKQGQVPAKRLIYSMCVFFIIQSILAFFACVYAKSYFKKANKEILESSSNNSSKRHSPVPIELYNKIILLMQLTLASFILFWVAIAIIAR